jgi:putative PIN family toxin of toxin-antitoxin system
MLSNMKVVLDTNIVVAALMTGQNDSSASRQVLRAALEGRITPLFGNALWLEYEDLLARPIWNGETTYDERLNVIRALAASGQWVSIYYGWRPNLLDEGDNHLIELAVAGNAAAIITHNVRDLTRGQLVWPNLRIVSPSGLLKELS